MTALRQNTTAGRHHIWWRRAALIACILGITACACGCPAGLSQALPGQASAPPAAAATPSQAQPPATPQSIFEPLIQARQLISRGQPAQAIPLIQQYIRTQPNEPSGHFWMGVALDASASPGQAIWAYSKSLDLAQRMGMDAVELRIDIGNTLLKLNRVDDAIFNYRRAIEIDGKSALAHFNLGRALLSKNQPEAAFTEFTRCDELGMTEPSGYLYRALALKAMGKPQDATAQAEMFLKRLSDTPENTSLKARIKQNFSTPAESTGISAP